MNMAQINAGDWDVLTQNSTLIIGNVSDETEIEFNITVSVIGEIVVPARRRPEIIMSPFVASLRGDLSFGFIEEKLLNIESGLISNICDLIEIQCAIGIPVEGHVVDVYGNLEYYLYPNHVLTVTGAVSYGIEFSIPLRAKIGKTVPKSKKEIKRLSKLKNLLLNITKGDKNKEKA